MPINASEPSIFHGDFGSIVIAQCVRNWAAHIHREHQVNFHIGGGDLLINADEGDYVLSASEMNLHNPYATHSVRLNPADPALLVTINVSADWLKGRIGPDQGAQTFERPHVRVSPEVRVLLDGVLSGLRGGNSVPADGLPRVYRLLDHIFSEHARASPPTERLRADDHDRRIHRSLDFIESNAVGKIKIGDVASFACMSRSHFYKQFKSCVGTSPLHMIDAVRVNWAVRCLSTTSMTIAEISDELGFSTPGHFTRFFTMHIGLRPSEYRARLHHLSPQPVNTAELARRTNLN